MLCRPWHTWNQFMYFINSWSSPFSHHSTTCLNCGGHWGQEKGWGKARKFVEGLLNGKCYFIEILPTTICYCPQLIEKETEAQISRWYRQDTWPGNVGAETWNQVHLVPKISALLTHSYVLYNFEWSVPALDGLNYAHLRGFKLRGGCNHSKLPVLDSYAQRQTWIA